MDTKYIRVSKESWKKLKFESVKQDKFIYEILDEVLDGKIDPTKIENIN